MEAMFKGKSVIVTGSTSGIGWGIAQAFAEKGCKVMLHGLENEENVASLKKTIESLSQESVAYCRADLSQAQACDELIHFTTKTFGKVDIVINNAGVQHTAPTENFPPEKWDFIINLNLAAAFHTSRAALPQMYARKWGRLIHIGSVHSLVASTHKAAYVAAKHGLLGFSKVVALEAAGTGVTSNLICPGWVFTPLVEKQIQDMAAEKKVSFEEAKKELLLEKQPSGEFVTPEALGAMSVFLASEHADQITGAAFVMDGGWTIC